MGHEKRQTVSTRRSFEAKAGARIRRTKTRSEVLHRRIRPHRPRSASSTYQREKILCQKIMLSQTTQHLTRIKPLHAILHGCSDHIKPPLCCSVGLLKDLSSEL